MSIYNLLHSRINCEYFPEYIDITPRNINTTDNSINQKIREISINSLNINTSKLKDNELAQRVIEYLRSHHVANPKQFIQTYELEAYLKNFVPEIKIERIHR